MNKQKPDQQAFKMYETRMKLRKLYGKNYKEHIAPFVHIIKEVMKANKLSPLEALLKVRNTELFTQSELSKVSFISATVEIISPSEEK